MLEERGITFERMVFEIGLGKERAVFLHPNQDKYPGQLISVVEVKILAALEAGVLKPVNDAEQHALSHRAAATATFVKDQRLNIRKSINDKRVKRQWRSR